MKASWARLGETDINFSDPLPPHQKKTLILGLLFISIFLKECNGNKDKSTLIMQKARNSFYIWEITFKKDHEKKIPWKA